MPRNDKRRKIFSISQEFEEQVHYILDNTPNYSRFICEAIIEKYEREKNPDKVLEDKIKTIVYNTITSSEMLEILSNLLTNDIKQISIDRQQESTPDNSLVGDSNINESSSNEVEFDNGDGEQNPTNKVPEIAITEDEVLKNESEDLGVNDTNIIEETVNQDVVDESGIIKEETQEVEEVKKEINEKTNEKAENDINDKVVKIAQSAFNRW